MKTEINELKLYETVTSVVGLLLSIYSFEHVEDLRNTLNIKKRTHRAFIKERNLLINKITNKGDVGVGNWRNVV